MSPYELTQRAHCDLEEIEDYFARRSAKTGREFLIRALEVFEMLATHPEAGRRRLELKVAVRSFSIGQYVVYYRIAEGRVQILRVAHGARDAAALLSLIEEI